MRKDEVVREEAHVAQEVVQQLEEEARAKQANLLTAAAHEARAMALLLTHGARREAEAALVEALEAYRRRPARPHDRAARGGAFGRPFGVAASGALGI